MLDTTFINIQIKGIKDASKTDIDKPKRWQNFSKWHGNL
jgi:hypothetical protein